MRKMYNSVSGMHQSFYWLVTSVLFFLLFVVFFVFFFGGSDSSIDPLKQTKIKLHISE